MICVPELITSLLTHGPKVNRKKILQKLNKLVTNESVDEVFI